MKNVEMNVEGNILIIKVDLSKEYGPSSSGKSIIVASTEGNVSIPDHEEKLGLCLSQKVSGSGLHAPVSLLWRLPSRLMLFAPALTSGRHKPPTSESCNARRASRCSSKVCRLSSGIAVQLFDASLFHRILCHPDL